jgi:hypothetical protein
MLLNEIVANNLLLLLDWEKVFASKIGANLQSFGFALEKFES